MGRTLKAVISGLVAGVAYAAVILLTNHFTFWILVEFFPPADYTRALAIPNALFHLAIAFCVGFLTYRKSRHITTPIVLALFPLVASVLLAVTIRGSDWTTNLFEGFWDYYLWVDIPCIFAGWFMARRKYERVRTEE